MELFEGNESIVCRYWKSVYILQYIPEHVRFFEIKLPNTFLFPGSFSKIMLSYSFYKLVTLFRHFFKNIETSQELIRTEKSMYLPPGTICQSAHVLWDLHFVTVFLFRFFMNWDTLPYWWRNHLRPPMKILESVVHVNYGLHSDLVLHGRSLPFLSRKLLSFTNKGPHMK